MPTPLSNNAYFHAAFPTYCRRLIPHTSLQTAHNTLIISGQVLPEYYRSPEAPPRQQTSQSLLLNEQGVSGMFEESHLQPHQATMSLTIIQFPTAPAQLNRFFILALSHLINHLRYPPSTRHPLIIRGKNISAIPALQFAAQSLDVPSIALSLRTYKLGFFDSSSPIMSKTSPIDIDQPLNDFILDFNTKRKTCVPEPISRHYTRVP
jgi:hypothetical protein